MQMRTGARELVGAALLLVMPVSFSAQKNDKGAKPSDSPASGIVAPGSALRLHLSLSRVVLTAELTGGADDFGEYCPTIEWEWGDLSHSESSLDCAPYEAGQTQIKRRFTVEHKFAPGSFKVFFRMKHGSKEVAAASTTVIIRQGAQGSDP